MKGYNELYMRRAIHLATLATARLIRPNPRVGAVLVYDEEERPRIIGEGYHAVRGEGHAEVNCLRSVSERDRPLIPHSTLYVTLEPCAHQGLTPSCATMIVKEGIPRVVVGCIDPNSQVAGQGIERLRSHHIHVTVGILEEECWLVAREFMTVQLQKRPWVTLKWAQTADGYLDQRRQEGSSSLPLRLSSPFTSILMHRERSQHAAICVGANTLLLDHPQLTNRLWYGASPRPIVIDPHGRCATLFATAFHDAKRWIRLSMEGAPKGGQEEVLYYPKGTSPLPTLFSYLLQEHLTSLMVEGGAATLQYFINEGTWDEARVEIAPTRLGEEGIAAPPLAPLGPPCHSVLIEGHILSLFYRKNSLP